MVRTGSILGGLAVAATRLLGRCRCRLEGEGEGEGGCVTPAGTLWACRLALAPSASVVSAVVFWAVGATLRISSSSNSNSNLVQTRGRKGRLPWWPTAGRSRRNSSGPGYVPLQRFSGVDERGVGVGRLKYGIRAGCCFHPDSLACNVPISTRKSADVEVVALPFVCRSRNPRDTLGLYLETGNRPETLLSDHHVLHSTRPTYRYFGSKREFTYPRAW